MKLLVFGGTTEGRLLAGRLAQMPGVETTVCVATDYGAQLLEELPGHRTVIARRLAQSEMEALMRQGAFGLVVDATHPYATEASANILAAAGAAEVPRVRLLREESGPQGCRYFSSLQQAADALRGTQGNILAATGSKQLEAYACIPRYRQRLVARVLPTAEAIEKCRQLEIPQGRIIAMQGPFSFEVNKALMRQHDIRFLVTKDGGDAGGFAEKMEAALALDIVCFVVGRPARESGLSLEEVMAEIAGRMEGPA